MKINHRQISLRALLLTMFLMISAQAADPRPNILFILVDDQRNDTLGCAGHPTVKTPHIDRLAAQGIRFTNAYVTTPICMSSRATIFTGLTEASHGYTGGGAPAIPVQPMDVDTSFPVVLRKSGYSTGFYGKQHVKFAESKKTALGRMFDDYRVYGGGPHFIKKPDGSQRHSAEIIGDHSVKFIKKQPAGRPFCLYMSFN
ncbi:MAG: sulfatase-like hydrolase/transferase, partial [Verrucomicrobiae bacterium]|nr:sulfatase-like hydrolase/transferase [Verrucomicrobiae bacterium]